MGDPAGQATLPAGTVVGAWRCLSGRTVVQVAAIDPVALTVTAAVEAGEDALVGHGVGGLAQFGRVVDAVVEGHLDVQVARSAPAWSPRPR